MSKELEYEINNFVNLLNKDCMNLMECLKKQSEDNKPILYLGKHYEKVILPYEEYKKMCNRLESIDNANPSEALECLENLCDEFPILKKDYKIIKQALIKAQEPKQYVDELKLVEKKLKALDLLMQELDCKDFAELRKYARCGYEKINNFKDSKEFKIKIPESSLMDYNPVKNYLKWEDLEFKENAIYKRVVLNGELYLLKTYKNFILDFDIVELEKTDGQVLFHINQHSLQLFNDLHLERVEE